MKIKAIKTKIFHEGEELLPFIFEYVKKVPENSILVITSKIVALSEGRTMVARNDQEKSKIIKRESSFAFKTKIVWLTIKDGAVMANAGIDESNAKGKLIFLPKDSFSTAQFLRKKLMQKFGRKNLGILITDSRLLPLRAGTVGVALGYAGFEGVKNYIGKPDIFGRKLKMQKTDVADSLATAAVLCMGEGNERKPLAVITDAPVIFTGKVNKKELVIDPKKDLYAPLFRKLNGKI